jgi:DNA-binding NtrC family response regulator
VLTCVCGGNQLSSLSFSPNVGDISHARKLMNSQPRILLIDKASNRKERINHLKSRGYAVFPALSMEEARSRCMRGGYDLIVVNANGDHDQAVQFCDEIRRQCPKQLLIMCSDQGGGGDYTVASDVSSVAKAVESVLNGNAKQADLASAA